METNGWQISSLKNLVVPYRQILLIGRDLFPKSQLQLIQKQSKSIFTIKRLCPKRLELITKISQFNQTFTSRVQRKITVLHQEGQQIPVHTENRVKSKINKLICVNHIEKLKNCWGHYLFHQFWALDRQYLERDHHL